MIVHSSASGASIPTEGEAKPVVTWPVLAAVAKAILSGTNPDDLDRNEVTLAIGYGLIESREQTKPCPTCGVAKFDFRFWRVTGAGRLLVQAQGDLEARSEANTTTEQGTER